MQRGAAKCRHTVGTSTAGSRPLTSVWIRHWPYGLLRYGGQCDPGGSRTRPARRRRSRSAARPSWRLVRSWASPEARCLIGYRDSTGVPILFYGRNMPNRARGQLSVTHIDRLHPWQVELAKTYVENEVRLLVTDWMQYRTPPGQGARRQVADRTKLRFAFTEQKQAEAFKAAFGGVLHDVRKPDRIGA